MEQPIKSNLRDLKKIAQEYYAMVPGELIKDPEELLPLFPIKKSGHPHKGLSVFISRRALKHFIERRKFELNKKYSKAQSLDHIFFIINHLHECIVNFEIYKFEPYVNHFYTKDYSRVDKPTICALVEKIEANLEIVSIHYKKKKKL